jgi:hypothetical protein
VEKPDLSKVDEIGWAQLMPGSGHGVGGFVAVSKFEVWGKPVPRNTVAPRPSPKWVHLVGPCTTARCLFARASSAHCLDSCVSCRSRAQNIARGLTSSPVLPGTLGGAMTSRNSH